MIWPPSSTTITRIALASTLSAGLLAGCAAPKPPSGTSFNFADYEVTIFLTSGWYSCEIASATLKNKGNRPLGYVYTRMLATTNDGVTVSDVGINFMPTVPRGASKAAHIDSRTVAMSPCDRINIRLSGSKG